MKVLLDTHIFLWALLAPERLDEETIEFLESTETEKYISAASGWEIANAFEKGQVLLPERPETFIRSAVQAGGILELPVTTRDAVRAVALPSVHSDQFDRLLVAQAQEHQMYIVTDDPVFAGYDVKIIDC